MSQDDIEYVLELLEDAVTEQDWDLIEEARQYLDDFTTKRNNSNRSDED